MENTVETMVEQMLKTSTGTSILDSGSAYGRNWQRNQTRDFKSEPACEVEIREYEGKPEIDVTYNVYHYLVNMLEYDDDCEYLQNKFNALADLPENEDAGWVALMETLADKYDNQGTTNTYNYDNLISQVLQYTAFKFDDNDYILLQIHQGCDVRGGYTKPQVFKVVDTDYFTLAQTDINAGCKNGHYWSSDDAGCNFWFDGCSSNKVDINTAKVSEGKLLCPVCNEVIQFSVTEQF
jgi:hypothetical protein